MASLSVGYGEALWRVCGVCLEGVGKLSGCFGETVWRSGMNVPLMWRDCLVGVGSLSGGYGEAVWRCGEAFWRKW